MGSRWLAIPHGLGAHSLTFRKHVAVPFHAKNWADIICAHLLPSSGHLFAHPHEKENGNGAHSGGGFVIVLWLQKKKFVLLQNERIVSKKAVQMFHV